LSGTNTGLFGLLIGEKRKKSFETLTPGEKFDIFFITDGSKISDLLSREALLKEKAQCSLTPYTS